MKVEIRTTQSLSMFQRAGRFALAGVALVGAIVAPVFTGLAWLIPPEVVQSRAVERADPADAYAQYEALGMAEAGQWSVRWFGLGLAGLCFVLWRRRAQVAPWIEGAVLGFWQVTATAGEPVRPRLAFVVATIKRLAILAALLLSVGHWGLAIRQRFRDWPYYQLNDGSQVLPNISDSNREVIRFLRSATPDDCRILVVSDQKLFFLSYYLRPRTLFHRMHPSAEHLIPRANQARQLAAYRLDELPADVWECQPDYVLEYFEGAEYVDPARTTEDQAWLAWLRIRSGDPSVVPGYVVRLRRWPLTEGQP